MTNNDDCQVRYQGWSERGAGPIIYCRTDDGEPWHCSESQSFIDLGAGSVPRDFYLFIDPGRAEKFSFRPGVANQFGIRVFNTGTLEGRILWETFAN